ncbi:TonB-dependent receptor [Pseudoalteromonas obscura]|uniref:TonB-dependent receptor n=1 Tax=Pseudoalteromonas obscura TaxID=3048491 RepID=A0ABT7ERS9_9GAMM|nr:TonB-dependent receptor [Pseudoalteromonas sp. P94(2023)]MDK2597734.1 TonB-dependent receptor [Pseudoalteromonas sp. P94(2023)]
MIGDSATRSIYTALLCTGLALPSAALAQQAHQLDIPKGSLAEALNTLALQTGVLLQFDPNQIGSAQTTGLKGAFVLSDGFEQLLAGTGLYAEKTSNGSYVIRALSSNLEHAVMLDTLEVYASNNTHKEIYQSASSDTKLSQDQLARVAPRDTSDIFYNVPGVTTSQTRQEPGVAVNVRGIQDFGRVNVMIDGARQNFQRSGHGANGTVYLDPQLLSSVDIAKGPVGHAGGAGAIGGVVNFNTLEFADLALEGKDHGSKVALATGSNAYHMQGLLASGVRLGKDLELVAAVGRKHVGRFEPGQHGGNAGNDNYFDALSSFTEQDQWSSLLKANYKINEQHAIKLSYVGFSANFNEGSTTGETEQPSATSKLSNDTIKVDYFWNPNSDYFDLSSSIYYNRTQMRQHQFELGDSINPYGEFELQYETNTFGLVLENISFFSLEHDWLSEADSLLMLNTGMEYFRDWTQPQAIQQTPGTGDPTWFTGATPGGSRAVSSAFFQTEWQYGEHLSIEAGVRYEHFSLEGGGEINSGAILNPPGVTPSKTLIYTNFAVARHDDFVSPNLRFAYRFNDEIQAYVSSAKGVRPPSITETLLFGMHVGNQFPFYPNPGLQAEESLNNEVGMNFEFTQLAKEHDLFIKTGWFENTVDNFIIQGMVMSPTSVSDKSGIRSYVNLQDEISFEGIELQADYQSKVMFAELNYTKMNFDPGLGDYNPFPLGSQVGFPATNLGKTESGGLLYIPPPKHSGAITLGLKLFDDSLKVGARMRFEDNDGRGGKAYEKVVDWEVYDVWLDYQYSPNIQLRMSIDNLKDLNYAEANGTSYWIAPGRSVIARITAKF